MAKKKPAPKKTASKKSGKKKAAPEEAAPRKPFLRAALSLVLLAVIVAAAAYLAYRWIPREPHEPVAVAPKERPIPVKKPKAEKPGAVSAPVYEVFPAAPVTKPTPPPVQPPPKETRPRVAIVIDDLGYDREKGLAFMRLPVPITASILPYGPFRREVAEEARKNGKQVMLHLPMQPLEYPHVDPGPGALLLSMDPDSLLSTLEADLARVPYAQGVNNHMGSAMTAESTYLYPIFTLLKKKHLFFVDSLTTSHSVARPSAGLLQLPFICRDVFLDHQVEAGFIEGQLEELVRVAKKQGYAVGIGHPHSLTYELLKEHLDEMGKDVDFVFVSELVSVPG